MAGNMAVVTKGRVVGPAIAAGSYMVVESMDEASSLIEFSVFDKDHAEQARALSAYLRACKDGATAASDVASAAEAARRVVFLQAKLPRRSIQAMMDKSEWTKALDTGESEATEEHHCRPS